MRDVVREQTALQIGLGRERELPAAVLHGRREAALLWHAPEELLEEADEAVVVEPGDRHGLDAVLEGLRVEAQADVEGRQVALLPAKADLLAGDVPRIDVGLDLDGREHAGLVFALPQRAIVLGDVACDARLRREQPRVREETVLAAILRREFVPELDHLLVGEGGLHPQPRIGERNRVVASEGREHLLHRFTRGHALRLSRRLLSGLGIVHRCAVHATHERRRGFSVRTG